MRENGFIVKYTHPNLIFISWNHWVPTYVRNEIKKQTGIQIDSFGNELNNDKTEDYHSNSDSNIDNLVLSKKLNIGNNTNNDIKNDNKKDKYKNIDTYRPSGNLIYNEDLFKKMKI